MQKEVIAGGDSLPALQLLPALQFCGGTVDIKGCLEVCVVVVNNLKLLLFYLTCHDK